MSKSKPPSKLNDGKYETVKRLGAGCFGEVYRGTDSSTRSDVAIKFESRHVKSAPQLQHEHDVILALRKDMDPAPQGIAEAFYYGVEGSFNCLVIQILGNSLEDHVQKCKGKFTVKTTVLIAQQVLQRIEYMHSKGFIHRDIKPENFMFGVKDQVHFVYIIDFGLSKKYWNDTQHVPPKEKLSLTGTARYASINAHKGHEQSRRDDLEAIGHMFFYFLRGSLPWSGLDAKTQEEKYRKICKKKEDTPVADLNTGFPKQFDDYLVACRKLEFSQKPDFAMLHGLFAACRESSWKDHQYQWFDEGKDPPGPLADLVKQEPFVQPDERKQQASGSKGGCCCVS